jgi:glycosyltransferase involved in cell wall biosynthesis
MEYPNVSILMPSYNRRKFLPLITNNLINMDYDKSKLELCIFDDGMEPLFTDETLKQTRKLLSPLKIVYKYDKKKRDIGVKRNMLVKMSKHKICIMMDDDDIYFSSYIKHSVETLKNTKAGLVGSNSMLFIYPNHNYKMSTIQCDAKRQIHEATMCFTKKYFNGMPGFAKSSLGEGAKMIDHNENNIALTDIKHSMICFCHSGNSFNKEQFYKYKTNTRITNVNILNILEDISGVKYDPDKLDSDEENEDDEKDEGDEEENEDE